MDSIYLDIKILMWLMIFSILLGIANFFMNTYLIFYRFGI